MKSMVCSRANHELIIWARKENQSSVDDTARRVGVSSEFYELVESGEEFLTLAQLRKLAEYLKRPVAIFFLPKAPSITKRPKSFRNHKGKLSPKTMLSFRRSRRIQSIAREFSPDEQDTPLWKSTGSPLRDAAIAREWLGVTDEIQTKSKSAGEFLGTVGELLAKKEIHLLLHSFPANDAQAYSFPESPRIITISTNKSNAESRLFSVFHELYHMRLGESALCYTNASNAHYQHERQCDTFAKNFLMPEKLVREYADITVSKDLELDEQLRYLNRRIKGSLHSLLIRLHELHYIEYSDVLKKVAEWQKQEPPRGFARNDAVANVIKSNGILLTNRVIDAYVNNHISVTDASRFLSVNQGYLEGVGARLHER